MWPAVPTMTWSLSVSAISGAGGPGAENDAGRAAAGDAADDACGGDALFPEGGEQGRGLGAADGHEQPARGLGVVEERLDLLGHGLGRRDVARGGLAVAFDRAGDDAVAEEVEDAGKDG